VRGALDGATGSAPRRTRPARWLAAAAAVLVVVAGIAWIALRSGSSDHPTAARSPAPSISAPGTTRPGTASGAGSDAARSNQALAPNVAAAADLGDLGEVADPGTLRTRVANAEALQKSASAPAGPCAAALASDHAELGPVVATGRATFHGRPATVVVTTNPGGERVAVVVLDAGCTVEAPVALSR